MYNMYLPYNNIFFLNPFIPAYNQKPPTLFSILNSIANFGKDAEERTKVKDLAKVTHTKIFDFDYPLSAKIDKDKFEINILNKFLKRRIGTETVVDFKIELEVKLNEIMPKYNKMFDFLDGWNLFNDGETIERTQTNNSNKENEENTTSESTTNNTLENISNNESNLIQSRRESNTPQAYIENVQDNAYLSKYNYNEDSTTSNDTTNSTGNSRNNTSNNSRSNETNTNTTNEKITRSPADKIKLYEEFQNNITNIYTMIYNELSPLFLQIL